MQRIAFTIIFNGKHHLEHNNYAEYILSHFDKWIVVEGAAGNTGSTAWCKSISNEYHNNGNSNDGTVEYLEELSNKYSNLIFKKANGIWKNKDEMVNAAIDEIKNINIKNCLLWEIDCDEQWTIDNISLSEKLLLQSGCKTGAFVCEYYVGNNLIAIGDWGEGKMLPYRRLWNWEGESFITHEPPQLNTNNNNMLILPTTFKHYAYYFEKDVEFKNAYYSGLENVLDKWKHIQTLPDDRFPIHISNLISGYWGTTNTYIHKK